MRVFDNLSQRKMDIDLIYETCPAGKNCRPLFVLVNAPNISRAPHQIHIGVNGGIVKYRKMRYRRGGYRVKSNQHRTDNRRSMPNPNGFSQDLYMSVIVVKRILKNQFDTPYCLTFGHNLTEICKIAMESAK